MKKSFVFLIFFSLACIGYAQENQSAILAAQHIAKEFQGKPRDGQTMMTLEQILQRVVSDNFEIRQKKAMLESASGEKMILRARALPDVNTSFMAGRYGERNENPAKNFAIFGGGIRQPLFEAGIPASWRLGDIAQTIAQKELQAAVEKKLHEARVTFYKALFYRGLILLNRQLEKRLLANLSNEVQKQKNGLSARGDVIRAKIQAFNQKPEMAEAVTNYKESLLQLAALIGLNLGPQAYDSFFPQGILEYAPLSLPLREETEYALKNRTDIQLLQTMISKTTEQKKVSEETYYPLVGAFFDGEFLPENALKNNTANSGRPGEDTRTSEYRIGGNMTWQVIDNGQVIGRSMSIQKKKENYEILLQQIKENIPRNLSVVDHSLKAEEARIGALQKAVELAEENLKNIEAQVAVGGSGQLDFLNAHSAFFEAKFGILKGLYQHNLALAELDRVTGRYLQYKEKLTDVSVQP